MDLGLNPGVDLDDTCLLALQPPCNLFGLALNAGLPFWLDGRPSHFHPAVHHCLMPLLPSIPEDDTTGGIRTSTSWTTTTAWRSPPELTHDKWQEVNLPST